MQVSSQSRSSEFETALRAAWARALKSIYWITARIYNRVLVTFLGYRAHELAADAFAAHWHPDGDRGGGRGDERTILDLGCGTGLTAEALLSRIYVRIDGIDFSEAMLDRAREKGIYRRLVRADISKPLPVEAGAYAGAISSGLFTHGHVGAEALEPIFATLAPGAIFAFTVYSKIWKRAGFEAKLEDLQETGRIEVLDHRETSHFRRMSGQRVHVLTVRLA